MITDTTRVSRDTARIRRSDTAIIFRNAPRDAENNLVSGAVAPDTVLLSRYRVIRELGAGPIGVIWLCYDEEDNQDVLLRSLATGLRSSKAMMALVQSGLRLTSKDDNPHIAATRRIVYEGSMVFLVSDYVHGQNLEQWRKEGKGGVRTLEEIIPILEQVADALDFAHELKIYHRNLKPSNVLVTEVDEVKVSDFALIPRKNARQLKTSMATHVDADAGYQAPELGLGAVPDSATDQYSLAAVAYELLEGSPPHATEAEMPASLPPFAKRAFRRALSHRARTRFVNCMDFVRALKGERVRGRRKWNKADWRRFFWVVGTIGTILVLSIGAYFGWQLSLHMMERAAEERVAAARAEEEQKRQLEILEKAKGPRKFVARTPLPVEGDPWVTRTAEMEFVWVFDMQMWVGRYEVTNEEYRKMHPTHDSGNYNGERLSGPRQPVVLVNFDDTRGYAEWLTEKEREAGKLPDGWFFRLPSRDEAIQYTRCGTDRPYPWGREFPPSRGNYADDVFKRAFPGKGSIDGYRDGSAATCVVENSGENEWGIFGAGGNVWETTTRTPGGSQFSGWQGGAFDDFQPNRLRSDVAYGYLGDARGQVNGFRLVLAREADSIKD